MADAVNDFVESAFEGLVYPESPRWRDGVLWISDVHSMALKAFANDGCLLHQIAVPERPAGSGFLPDGRLLLATGIGRKLHILEGNSLSSVADLNHLANSFLNDIVVDAKGRVYVGDTGFRFGEEEPRRTGQIFRYDPDGTARTVATEVFFPNGMVISPDGETLYVAETFGNCISRFSIDADGNLSNRRVHAQIDGKPDGICLDDAGGLWVATLDAGRFDYIDASGKAVNHIALSGENAVACMLGGEDRRTLFLCSSGLEQQPDGTERRFGRVRTTKTVIAGAGLP